MSHDPARARFFIIHLSRFAGILVVLLGMAVSRLDLLADGGAPVPGFLLMLLGLAAFVFVPKLLARRWRASIPSEGDERGR